MTHRSRLAGFIIDCRTDDLDAAGAFWAAALGREVGAAEGAYRPLGRRDGLYAEVQKVSHPSRVHIDIETDDPEAEARRLTALGAREVARIKSWIVMEAPTGHRFCLVSPDHRADFDASANEWGDDA